MGTGNGNKELDRTTGREHQEHNSNHTSSPNREEFNGNETSIAMRQNGNGMKQFQQLQKGDNDKKKILVSEPLYETPCTTQTRNQTSPYSPHHTNDSRLGSHQELRYPFLRTGTEVRNTKENNDRDKQMEQTNGRRINNNSDSDKQMEQTNGRGTNRQENKFHPGKIDPLILTRTEAGNSRRPTDRQHKDRSTSNDRSFGRNLNDNGSSEGSDSETESNEEGYSEGSDSETGGYEDKKKDDNGTRNYKMERRNRLTDSSTDSSILTRQSQPQQEIQDQTELEQIPQNPAPTNIPTAQRRTELLKEITV